ncbi:MAG: hypothetical protein AAGB51_00445 [Planctomycetota bacterium]
MTEPAGRPKHQSGTDGVVARLQRALDVCRQVESLGEHQKSAVIEQGVTALAEATSARIRLDGRLREVAAELGALAAAWDQHLAGLSPNDIQRAEVLRSELREVAGRVLERDSGLTGDLRGRLDELHGKVGGMNTGRRAVQAYGGLGGDVAPGFQDRQA